MATRSSSSRAWHATRPWRVFFVAYAIALTVGTHWPRLDLDVGDLPAPDKILHMLGFGGLAFLLWRTRWIMRIRIMLPILLLWALLDEITQAIPILGRSFSLLDVLGGWLGIFSVMAWVRALRSTRGPLSALRCSMVNFAIDEMFLRPRTWLAALLAGMAGAAIGGIPIAIAVNNIQPRSTLAAGLATAFATGVSAALVVLDRLWRSQRDVVIAEQLCQWCGAASRDAVFDDQGYGHCSQCDGQLHRGQWQLLSPLPNRAVISPVRAGVGMGIVAAGLVFVTYMLMHLSATHTPWLVELMDRAAGPRAMGIPADLRLVIDMTVIAIVAAFITRVIRHRRNVMLDRQHHACMACGHDVRATPVCQGIGQCGECGWRFVRISPHRDYAVTS